MFRRDKPKPKKVGKTKKLKNMKRKITSYYSLMAIAAVLFVSCNIDEEVAPVNSQISNEKEVENVVLEKTSLEELGFSSMEEFLASGVTEMKIISGPNALQKVEIGPGFSYSYTPKKPTPSKPSPTLSKPKPLTELMTSAQVDGLKLGNSKIKDLYKIGGKKPTGVTINDWQSSGAFSKFNLAKEYGEYAYVGTGDPTITKLSTDKPEVIQMSSFIVSNYSDEETTIWRSFSYTTGTNATVSKSATVGIEFEGKMGFPLSGSSAGVKVSISGTMGEETTTISSKTDEYKIAPKLPPHSQKTIYVTAVKKTVTYEYKVPVKISGKVVSNFDKKVQGARIWFCPASRLMQGKEKVEIGTISIVETYDVHMSEGAAIPLKGSFPGSNNYKRK